ncbi:uncharacterized protein BROUX77_003224 [Berkeleyomyces rouxiae]|uniref:uncharacterized protein n=1 Tax=Berkeleyomyces rouxiae TaxID=2035830 RepID=UPI003B78308E
MSVTQSSWMVGNTHHLYAKIFQLDFWDALSAYVTDLFRLSLRWGHHPEPSKRAAIVAVPKPDKDPSVPTNWRPISLLPCLGKGLERLIARRMSFTAPNENVIHPQQFGALPKRCTTDLAACLIHDIERNWAKGLTTTMVTLDIQGAFDAVLPGQLQCHLRKQGWSAALMKWVNSFMNGRKGHIWLASHRTPDRHLSCGVPQGSPVSPILFMLFLQPLFDSRRKFGYADDVAIIARAKTPEEATKAVEMDLRKMAD